MEEEEFQNKANRLADDVFNIVDENDPEKAVIFIASINEKVMIGIKGNGFQCACGLAGFINDYPLLIEGAIQLINKNKNEFSKIEIGDDVKDLLKINKN